MTRHFRIGMSAVALLAAVTLLSLLPGKASAAITELALWKLGEPGSIVGGFPQDSVGGHHFLNDFGTQAVITPGAPLPSSTAAHNYTPIGGQYGAATGTTVIPTDNFAIELWARSDNVNQTTNDFFTTNGGPVNGTLKITTVNTGNWAASLHNVSWIGGNAGAGQPATANKWTNLAVIRSNGVLTFYIDGVAQAGTVNSAPNINATQLHIGVTPGGASAFDGALDELRIFSFDPNTDNPVSALSIVSRGLYATNGDFEGSGQTTTGNGAQDILGWFDSTPGFSSWEFGRTDGMGGSNEAGTLDTGGWMYQSLGTYFAENGTLLKWSLDAVNTNTGNGAGDPFELAFYSGAFPGAAEGVDIAGAGLNLIASGTFNDSGTNTVDVLNHMGLVDLAALPDGTEIWIRIEGGGFDGVDNVVISQTNPIPEPATAGLALMALAGLGLRRRK